MSTETTLTADITYFGKSYDSLWKVEDDIALEKSIIDSCRQDLLALAVCTEPEKLLKAEECDDKYLTVLDRLTNMVNTRLNDLIESQETLTRLEILKYNWEKSHTVVKDSDGVDVTVAKESPEGFEPPYLNGDWIKTDRDILEERKSIREELLS